MHPPTLLLLCLHRKGDYYHCKAEFSVDEVRKEAGDNSLTAYEAATKLAVGELASTHPRKSLPTRGASLQATE